MIYQNLKRICKCKGIRISKMEHDLGFTRGSLYKWGSTNPSIVKAKAVADYLNVSLEALLEDPPAF